MRRRIIGELAPLADSFVGAASQLRLGDRVTPEWAQMLKAEHVDLVVLVPV